MLSSSDASMEDASGDAVHIQQIYIQSFSGPNLRQVQEVFFDTVAQQDQFTFVELLPDDYTNLKILRIDITDYSVWENNEALNLNLDRAERPVAAPEEVIRRNALVGFRVSLYEAETGKLLLRKPYSQPFQQIYLGEKELESIPDKEEEMKRLTKTLVYKLLSDLQQANSDPPSREFEKGYGYDWISNLFYNFGDKRIKKGNRYAKAGEYDQAIWMWQLVLYEPAEDEPIKVYQKNRASAYYNLGVVYQKLGDLLKAAEMFSMANRMKQTLKYAQAWGSTMQTWLEEQKGGVRVIDQITLKSRKERDRLQQKPSDKKQALRQAIPPSEEELLKAIERNKQLLLKARELWPLEPALKDLESPDQKSQTGESPNLFLDETSPRTLDLDLVEEPVEEGQMETENNLIKKVPEAN